MRAIKLPRFHRDPDKPTLRERAAALKEKAKSLRPSRQEAPRWATSSEAPTDWSNPPEGFMAYPALAPQGFMALNHALPQEAQRLYRLASAEFDRLRPYRLDDPAVLAQTRSALRVDELRDAAYGRRALAETSDRRALIAYATWLHYERANVCREMYPHLGWKAATFVVGDNSGFAYHRDGASPASSRAAAVLDLVGCEWSDDPYLGVGDQNAPAPEAKAYPHPDARLIDLEAEWLVACTAFDTALSRCRAADALFQEREAPFAEADEVLRMRPGSQCFWPGDYLRKILADRFAPVSRKDADLVESMSRADLERLLPLAEERDARQKALQAELATEALEEAYEAALEARTNAAEEIYRLPASTFEGLALKARVLRVHEPDLRVRPSAATHASAAWHEIALTEIADGVEQLLAVGGHSGTTPVGAPPRVDVDYEEGTVAFADAAGKTVTQTIAQWISHMALRMHGVAANEVTRRFNAECDGQTEAERIALDGRLRRELRTDALFALAFRSDTVLEAAHAARFRMEPDEVPIVETDRADGCDAARIGKLIETTTAEILRIDHTVGLEADEEHLAELERQGEAAQRILDDLRNDISGARATSAAGAFAQIVVAYDRLGAMVGGRTPRQRTEAAKTAERCLLSAAGVLCQLGGFDRESYGADAMMPGPLDRAEA